MVYYIGIRDPEGNKGLAWRSDKRGKRRLRYFRTRKNAEKVVRELKRRFPQVKYEVVVRKSRKRYERESAVSRMGTSLRKALSVPFNKLMK